MCDRRHIRSLTALVVAALVAAQTSGQTSSQPKPSPKTTFPSASGKPTAPPGCYYEYDGMASGYVCPGGSNSGSTPPTTQIPSQLRRPPSTPTSGFTEIFPSAGSSSSDTCTPHPLNLNRDGVSISAQDYAKALQYERQKEAARVRECLASQRLQTLPSTDPSTTGSSTTDNPVDQGQPDGLGQPYQGSVPPLINPTPPKLIDPTSFANAGSGANTVDKAMEELISGQSEDNVTNKNASGDEIENISPGDVSTSRAQAAAADSVKQFMLDSKSLWGEAKDLKEFAEPFVRLQDALDMADVAASGRVPTTISSLDQVATYVDKQENALDKLSLKGATDWLAASGINEHDREGTIQPAQQYLDNWSQRLDRMQQVIQKSLPSLQTAQQVLENPVVDGARMALKGSEAGLDPIALADVIQQLKTSSAKITAIQRQLSAARSVVY
jgi:hypothetical protein